MENNNNRTSAESMAALQSACEKKNFISFKNLRQGEYIVKNFCIVDTQHGKRVQIDVNDGYMLLPERFLTVLPQLVIDDLNKSPKIMSYKGKDVNDGNRLILDFKDVDYFNGFMNDYMIQNLS